MSIATTGFGTLIIILIMAAVTLATRWGGVFVMAYVPIGVYGHLLDYTRPDYTHRYFVDGQAFTGDADLSGE